MGVRLPGRWKFTFTCDGLSSRLPCYSPLCGGFDATAGRENELWVFLFTNRSSKNLGQLVVDGEETVAEFLKVAVTWRVDQDRHTHYIKLTNINIPRQYTHAIPNNMAMLFVM